MESCEDDTEVESIDGSTSISSGSETELEDKPPDFSASTLANIESCDTKDDLIPPSSNDTEEREDSDVILRSGELVLHAYVHEQIYFPYLALLINNHCHCEFPLIIFYHYGALITNPTLLTFTIH